MCKVTISLYDFTKIFPNEQAARKYLESRRWKDEVICPYCNDSNTKQMDKTQYFQCNMCRIKFTIRTGTIMERSHIPLDKWLYVMYSMATARRDISSSQLSKEIGITQKSAWGMLRKLRESCGNDSKILERVVI